ncbi:hypothetical protein [Pedobacter sp. SL55]|uniref:hypothetical protein n=1 Tax=Pedobacter sp. SL55 TaxID=2995161 RepID=UPI00226E6191|nr:hypothetical protein [Pedobacter sp. SL55]WAC39248.1 hypothetical protein OVA16_11575 [Pedobacter sp. SL55]
MLHDTIPIYIHRLTKFYPNLNKLARSRKLEENSNQLIDIDVVIPAKDDEDKAFENRYLALMEKYNIPTKNYGDILYICQKPLYDFEHIKDLQSIDAQTENALDFLIGYQELVIEVAAKRAAGKEYYAKDKEDAIIIQVKDKHTNEATPLIYDGAGRFIVKMIYNAFKTSFRNISLSYLLADYDDIPPLEKLKELKSSEWESDKRIQKEMVHETAHILTQYFEEYIPKAVLSRKKNLFIYELFYLFNILQYAGKVSDIETLNIKREHLRLRYRLPLEKKYHTSLISELLKNYNKRKKHLSSAFLNIT